LGPKIPHRKILETNATEAQLYQEKINSFKTQLIFFIMGIGLYLCYQKGLTRVYTEWDARGIFYFFLSYFIMHQLHDAYFYWTHRWMHEWKWLAKYHFVHHESSPPTPYSSLSFHPVEAFTHGLFWYIIAFTIPMPAHWLFGFYSFMFYINMWGHTSYEFWHKDLLTHPLLHILNTPTHHNIHHKYHKKNYSIYYGFWDKVCGTGHAEYENHYRKVKAQTELHKTSKIFKLLKL
jgi:sterol desaturase/sphingolipid hydroxylase (fatty acid hydroxylase superfamily)